MSDYILTTEEVMTLIRGRAVLDGATASEAVDAADSWLVGVIAEKRAEWEAEQGETEWEYVPGWLGGDGRARVSAGVIAPGFVGQFILDGGEVLRRRVGRFEAVTADTAPVEGSENDG